MTPPRARTWRRARKRAGARGFTLVEVLVALMVVALGLTALMLAVSGTATASGILRDKAIAEWIGLNRIIEVRLNLQKLGTNTDKGELDFANRHWRYDTQYFDTEIPTMRRVVVRVWPGSAAEKASPVGEFVGFLSTSLGSPGNSNTVDWTTGSLPVTTGGGRNGQGQQNQGGTTTVLPGPTQPTPTPTPTPNTSPK